jgi:hypothetical protein
MAVLTSRRVAAVAFVNKDRIEWGYVIKPRSKGVVPVIASHNKCCAPYEKKVGMKNPVEENFITELCGSDAAEMASSIEKRQCRNSPQQKGWRS